MKTVHFQGRDYSIPKQYKFVTCDSGGNVVAHQAMPEKHHRGELSYYRSEGELWLHKGEVELQSI